MYKAIALKELYDEDWKSQLMRKYPNIPEGAEVDVMDTVFNFYGDFMLVNYNGQNYHIKREDIKRKD